MIERRLKQSRSMKDKESMIIKKISQLYSLPVESIKKEISLDSVLVRMAIEPEFYEYIFQKFNNVIPSNDTILDSCAGSGLFSHVLAIKYTVISVEIDPMRLEIARKFVKFTNAKINLLPGSIIDDLILNSIPKVSAAFLDPDWRKANKDGSFDKMEPPLDVLLSKIKTKTNNIMIRLPRTTDLSQLARLVSEYFTVEEFYIDEKMQFYVAYLGKFANPAKYGCISRNF
jgi:16S rRNA G966 N2-methylase RsmD